MSATFKLRSSTLTHPGRKRGHNEDYVAYFEPGDPEVLQSSGRVYVVADGVGGAAEGERASQYAAVKVLHEYYLHPEQEPGERLRQAMRLASREIFEYAESDGGHRRMATTTVAAAIHGDRLTVANVGDSRAYLIREGKAWQVTTDHTAIGELLEEGALTEAEAMNSTAKNRLTRSLGAEPDAVVDVFPDIPLQPGDKLLLCSDGLTRYALAQNIFELTASGTPEEVTERVVDYANRKGGADNVSVIFVEVMRPEEALVAVPSRGNLPSQVDWESLATQPASSRRGRAPRAMPAERKKSALRLTAGVMALFTVAVLATFGLNSWFHNGQQAAERTRLAAQASQQLATRTWEAASLLTVEATQAQPPAVALLTDTLPLSLTVTATLTSTLSATVDPLLATPNPASATIPADSWCFYTVKNDTEPQTVEEIIRWFAAEGTDLQKYKPWVLAESGTYYENIWPNGWTENLPDGARIALAFVESKETCESKGGNVQKRPTPTSTPTPGP
jgi:protein phosphatase